MAAQIRWLATEETMRLAAPLVLLLAGWAAATAAIHRSQPVPADDGQVARCIYLDTVTGSSPLYGLFAAEGLSGARGDAWIGLASLVPRTSSGWARSAGTQHKWWPRRIAARGNASDFRCCVVTLDW